MRARETGENDAMRKLCRTLALVLAVALAAPLVWTAPAFAQYREFSGQVQKINDRELIVDNRMGDKVKFVKPDEVEVSGEGKAAWDDLDKGDWVTVSWKFIDKPRKAYKVSVSPPPEEEGEDM
jgi:hypothetical protein